MKKTNFLFGSFAVVVLAACSVPKTEVKDPLKDVKFPEAPVVGQGSGQPGETVLSGVVVTSDQKLSPYVTLSVRAGRTTGGQEIRLQEKSQPKLQAQFSLSDSTLNSLKNSNKVILVDCPSDVRDQIANERPYDVKEFKSEDLSVAIVSAQTVVLCGKVPSLRGKMVQLIQADELILAGAEMEHQGGIGSLSLTANHLTLWGVNQIKMIGATSGPVTFGAGLTLAVKESISADDEGRLAISVRGGDLSPKK